MSWTSVVIFTAGLAIGAAGIFTVASIERPCPDMLVVSTVIAGCQIGDAHACSRLEGVAADISARCLMDRAFEAADARRLRMFDSPEEMAL